MAAHARDPIGTDSKPKKCVSSERRRYRSSDPETALGLQLATVVEQLDVDVLLVGDLDGAAVASAGNEDDVIALAQVAAGLIKESPVARTVSTTRGFVHVDLVDARGRSFVLAAFARHAVPHPIAVSRAVAGAARILRDGLSIATEAPLQLLERGWGDWSFEANPAEARGTMEIPLAAKG